MPTITKGARRAVFVGMGMGLFLLGPHMGWAAAPRAGDVRFTELMVKGADSMASGEWVELKNLTGNELDLQGCFLKRPASSTATHEITSPVIIGTGGLALLADDDLTGPCGITPDHIYDRINLIVSGPDDLVLECPDGAGGFITAAEITYDWSIHRGADREFDGTSLCIEADGSSCVCPSAQVFCTVCDGGGACQEDLGSPDRENPTSCQVETPDGGSNVDGGDGGDGGAAAPPPGPGEAVFTELMVEPVVGPEWIEVRNLAATDLDLQGCTLNRPSTTTGTHTIGASVPLPAGGVALLSRGDFPEGCPVAPDYTYSSIDLIVSREDTLRLECPDGAGDLTLVTEVAYDWSDHRDDAGTSLYLEADGSSCLCPDAQPFCGTCPLDGGTCEEDLGTPGTVNPTRCPVPPPLPTAQGDVRITELMVEPLSSPEWIEIQNQTSGELGLHGCRLYRPSTSTGTHNISDPSLSLPAGGIVLLARSTPSFPEGCDVTPHYRYSGSIDLIVSKEDRLVIACPDDTGAEVVIDEAVYDWSDLRDFKGRSLCAPNLGIYGWCLCGSLDAPYCVDEWGTPGTPNPEGCAPTDGGQPTDGGDGDDGTVTPPPPPPPGGCLCSNPVSGGGGTGPTGSVGLGLGLLVLLLLAGHPRSTAGR